MSKSLFVVIIVYCLISLVCASCRYILPEGRNLTKAEERNIRLKNNLAAKKDNCDVLTARRDNLRKEYVRLRNEYNARLQTLKRQQEIQTASECGADSLSPYSPQKDAELIKLEREIEEKKQELESLNNQIHLIN